MAAEFFRARRLAAQPAGARASSPRVQVATYMAAVGVRPNPSLSQSMSGDALRTSARLRACKLGINGRGPWRRPPPHWVVCGREVAARSVRAC